MLGIHRRTTRSCCQLQARAVGGGTGLPGGTSMGNWLLLETETPFFSAVHQKQSRQGILGGHVETESARPKLAVGVPEGFPVHEPQKMAQGCAGLSARVAVGMPGSRGPCQGLQHPTSSKDASQRRNPILCQALVTFIPAGQHVPSCPFQGRGHALVCGYLN